MDYRQTFLGLWYKSYIAITHIVKVVEYPNLKIEWQSVVEELSFLLYLAPTFV